MSLVTDASREAVKELNAPACNAQNNLLKTNSSILLTDGGREGRREEGRGREGGREIGREEEGRRKRGRERQPRQYGIFEPKGVVGTR